MRNIKEKLLTEQSKLQTVCPDLIDHIYRFENLNDFTKNENSIEQSAEFEKPNNKGRKKRGLSQKPLTDCQFGNKSSGIANLILQQHAVKKKKTLRETLETNLQNMIKRYQTHEVSDTIKDTL